MTTEYKGFIEYYILTSVGISVEGLNSFIKCKEKSELFKIVLKKNIINNCILTFY